MSLISVSVLLMVQAGAEPPTRVLTPVDVRFNVEFSAVSGARELSGRRLVVSDFRAPAIYVFGPPSGGATTLGRAGSGPGEYLQPGGVYSGRADTVYVVDRGQARVAVIAPNGQMVTTRAINLRGVSSGSDADIDRYRVDAAGNVFMLDPSSILMALRGGAGASGDSAALLRYTRSGERPDTVARLRQRERRVTSASGQTITSQIVLFSPADGWAVAPDGRVAVIRADPYRVDWVTPSGQVLRGASVTHDRVQVTDADREAVRTSPNRSSLGVANSGGRASPGGGREPVFAAVKPPFDPDAIIISPDGKVWVGRYQSAASQRVVYDVFDERGGRVDRVELPSRSRIVGFGPTTVFVARYDADDVPTLRAFAR